ncbi:MAG: hypothetical protein KA040_01235 [Aliarcobacter sp.]|nr:hypothetical protein [Aliarcobacter sp.]
MKKSRYVGIFLFLGVVSLFAQTNRYDVKSGMVEYEIIGSGDVMGSPTTVSGTSKLYFKDFGNVELSDEKIQQTVDGDKEEERLVSKIMGENVYTVDFVDEVIYTQKMVLDDDTASLNIKSKEAFISMGAKNLGVEEILGYKCDVWLLGEDKIWVYNSVPLKLISKSLGLVQIQEAKLAVFNIIIKDDKFKLPSYPVKAMDEIIGEPDLDEMPPTQEEEKAMDDIVKKSSK